jgi:hypothetical protein
MRTGLVVAIVLSAGVSAACRNIDVVTASYATLAEARAAGAVQRGYVPDGIPPGAHDLREAHDLDTNRRWGLFGFPANERPALEALLDPTELPIEGLRCDMPGRIEWWPVLLRGQIDGGRARATGLRAYRTKAGDLVFLVNWNQGRAYYWTEP